MPERYRDVLGRWVSASRLPDLARYMAESFDRETQRAERVQTFERTEESQAPPSRGNWTDTSWPGGGTVRTAGGSPLTQDAFRDFPPGHTGFQVRFIIPDNPDYPRGWASYTYIDAGDWSRIDAIREDGARDFGATEEPDEDGVVRTGVGAIIFYESPPAPWT